MDDHLSAPVYKGLMLPRLLFGLPWMFALCMGAVAYELIIMLGQYIFGIVLLIAMYILGRVAAANDIFFFDIIAATVRYKGLLK